MSATIYSIPKEFKDNVPNVWEDENNDYQLRVDNWINDLVKWCKIRISDKSKYIGRVIKFPVADGYAEYMVSSLQPLQLIHLPLMDEYQAQHVDLMTVARVKELIDGDDMLQAFFNRVPEKKDIEDYVKSVCIDTTNMDAVSVSEKLIKKFGIWENRLIKWGGVNYLLPKFDYKKHNHEVFKYLANNCNI